MHLPIFHQSIHPSVYLSIHYTFMHSYLPPPIHSSLFPSVHPSMDFSAYQISCMIYLKKIYGCSTGSLTGAGHWPWVHVSSVKSLLAGTLWGFLLMGETVRRTLGAVGIHGRGLVGAWPAGCKTETRRLKD